MMQLFIFAIVMFSLAFPAALQMPSNDSNGTWVKYVTWEGDVDEMLVLRIQKEEVKSDFPLGSGFKNAKYTFYSDEPESEFVAKVVVENGRGNVAMRKQYWHRPSNFLLVQIYDKEAGWGNYKFTVYVQERKVSSVERKTYNRETDAALYLYDIYLMEKSIAEDNLLDALRWARNAYEINRLNWDILNKIGELYYKLNKKENAEDVFIVLRDYGYLTEENMARFKEIAPYEYSKMEKKSEEPADENGEDESEGEDTEEKSE